MRKNKTISALSHSLWEYLLIVLPIVIYISIEATHKGWKYFFTSPEWSIGSIFLSVQAISILFFDLKKSGKNISENTIYRFCIIAAIITIFATINTYSSINKADDTIYLISIRWILFTITSFSFIILVSAGKISNL